MDDVPNLSLDELYIIGLIYTDGTYYLRIHAYNEFFDFKSSPIEIYINNSKQKENGTFLVEQVCG